MNPYVAWKSYYSVGDPAMDAEHQRLLALINKIYEAVQRGDDEVVAKSALNVMLQYALSHFQHEEQLMRERGFPTSRSTRPCTRSFDNRPAPGMRRRTWSPGTICCDTSRDGGSATSSLKTRSTCRT